MFITVCKEEVKLMKHFSWILRIFHIFVLYAWIAFILLLPASPLFSLQLYVLLNILFSLVFTGLLISQIVETFKIFKREDSEQCIKAFLCAAGTAGDSIYCSLFLRHELGSSTAFPGHVFYGGFSRT